MSFEGVVSLLRVLHDFSGCDDTCDGVTALLSAWQHWKGCAATFGGVQPFCANGEG
jgi:hypothetical protein